MTGLGRDDKRRRRLVLAGLLALTCVLGLRGIGDESSVMLGGDMARYVMNGVFIRDLIADGGVTSYGDLARYAERYYAKYPALSLGHHPPLPYLSVVPFCWVFGVSLFAVRLAALFWFLLAVWGLHAVSTRMFSWPVSAWAAALFATNLLVLRSGQYLLSEMPMAALVIWAVHALLRFCDSRRPAHFVWFLVILVASLYAKQLAVLMIPVYGVILVTHLGWRSLITPRALAGLGIALAFSVPLVLMTVRLAPENFAFALANATGLFAGNRSASANRIISTILSTHLSIPALIVTTASVAVLIVRRQREVLIGLAWIVCVVGGSVMFAGATEPARYAFAAIPAYFLLTAGLTTEAHTRTTKALAAMVLLGTFWWQLWSVRSVYPSGAGGYETAAEYVLAQAKEPAILYDSAVDTGYFIFFVRKHDPNGAHVVLRADKIIGRGSGDLDQDRADLHAALQRLGVRWIVTEERTTGPKMLRMFYEEFGGPRFVLRQRIPVVSTAAPGLNLFVYEYLEAQPPDYDARISIDLPLGQRDFSLHLRDLVKPR
jgi:hypothetical protein